MSQSMPGGVRGGTLDGEEPEGGGGVRRTESLFEIRCKVEVKLTMGMGRYVHDLTSNVSFFICAPL